MKQNPSFKRRYIRLLLVIAVIPFALSCTKETPVAPQSSAKGGVAVKNAATTQTTVTTETSSTTTSLALTNSTATPSYIESPVITLDNASNVTISGKAIAGGSAAPITLTNCHDIHITNCKLYNSTNVGIYLYNCYNITVDQNYITNVSTGVYVDHSANGGILIVNNQLLNMVGPMPRGQFVQFNNVNGANNKINNNNCENIMGQSNPEDGISLYQSNGTTTSPITVNGNRIRGGGPSSSGGGIMLGDGGGSNEVADGNMLVNPGQYGIAISGGANNSITNNLVYGVSQSFTNVGLYVAAMSSSIISNCTVTGNKIKFYNSKGVLNSCWLASGLLAPIGWITNDWNANIDASIVPSTLITYK